MDVNKQPNMCPLFAEYETMDDKYFVKEMFLSARTFVWDVKEETKYPLLGRSDLATNYPLSFSTQTIVIEIMINYRWCLS